MYYDALAQGVKHFKETEKGRDQMCEAVENYAKELGESASEDFLQRKNNADKKIKSTHKKELAKAIFSGFFAVFTIVVLVLF